MIYDCFTFFNELDLLEIRLNTLDKVVDKFVLVEATKTHQGKDKPLFYDLNKKRFELFQNKIIHIVVNRYPSFWRLLRKPRSWDYENNQRNWIAKGLSNCSADDCIIISDLDEIPNPQKILENINIPGVKIFEQRLFQFYLNLQLKETNASYPIIKRDNEVFWCGSVMLKHKDFTTPQKARNHVINKGNINIDHFIQQGGWHFSYMGGVSQIIYKLNSFAHSEFNTSYFKDPERLEDAITNGKDIFDRNEKFIVKKPEELIDYPDYILNNSAKYNALLKSN